MNCAYALNDPNPRRPAPLSASDEYGGRMYEGVDAQESALPTADPADVHAVTHKALASAITVIARAGDSSGSPNMPQIDDGPQGC